MKAVVLDFDGVVADTMPALTRLGAFVIRLHFDCPRYTALELYKSTCGLPFNEQLQECFPRADVRYAAEYFEYRKELLMQDAFPFSDISLLLLRLRATNTPVALSSSTRYSIINAFLLRHRIHFDRVGTIEQGSKLLQLRASAVAFGLCPEQLVFLGDSDRDATFAAAAGVEFRRVTPEREAIKALINDFDTASAQRQLS